MIEKILEEEEEDLVEEVEDAHSVMTEKKGEEVSEEEDLGEE